AEGVTPICEQSDRFEQVVDHDGLVDVELKVPLAACECDRCVVAVDLRNHHGDGFGLGGVDFAGHDGGAGLVFGNAKFADTATWSRRKPAYIIGDLHDRASDGTDCAGGEGDRIVGRQRLEFIGV